MNIKEFIKGFIQRKGISVGFASAVEKIGGFLLVLIATNHIPTDEFGLITYANTSLVFIIPFIGFGIHQGLIRYGSLSRSQIQKKYLFNITLKKGIWFSLILTGLIIILTPFIAYKLKESKIYLIILSIQLVSLFVFEIVRIYARLINLNKLFSQITIVKTIFIVLIAYVLTLNYSGIGYVWSLALIPLLVAVFYILKLKLIETSQSKSEDFNLKEFLSYGLYSSLSGVLSQLLFAVDILLIGNILVDETLVAQYKVSNILPFSFIFIAGVFLGTDFVKIASKSETDKSFVKSYYINYVKIFSVLSILIVLFFFLFSDFLISLFGDNYSNDLHLMQIFSIGVMGVLLLRLPLGNILSAIGWPKINTLNSFVVLILNLIFSYIFITKYGIVGAAMVTAAMMWLSGILSLIAFVWYLKKD